MKAFIIAAYCLAGVFLLSGCSRGEDVIETAENPSPKEYQIFYLNQEGDEIEGEVRPLTEGSVSAGQLIRELGEDPKNENLKRLLGTEISLLGYTFSGGQLVLNFGESYHKLPKAEEVLFRASVVHTLTQDEAVDEVSFEVMGEPLKGLSGKEVGIMNDATFIDNAGAEISTYARRTIRLYFADADGTGLKRLDQSVVYNVNTSLEKLVMEKLISGPTDLKYHPTLSPDIKLNAINVKDGICYVSLDTSLVNKPLDVTEQVVLYSIVNSLTELPGVSRVQISVNGETDRMLRTEMSLSVIYDPNPDIVD